jgi:hypothetical protein
MAQWIRTAPAALAGIAFAAGIALGQAPAGGGAAGTTAVANGNAGAALVVLDDSVNTVGPVVDHLHQVLVGLNPGKWKAPGSMRQTAQSDIDSMQRDVSGVLPDLIEKAKAAPRSVGPAFALYRNIDALYDVLLRVSETATLAGSRSDSSQLEAVRAELENARSQLGDGLLQASTDQDAQVTQLQAAVKAAAAAAHPAPASRTVVDDGPAAAPARSKLRRRKKTTPPPASNSSQPQP